MNKKTKNAILIFVIPLLTLFCYLIIGLCIRNNNNIHQVEPLKYINTSKLIGMDSPYKTSIPVLMYHSIKYEAGNPVRMSTERFEAQMNWLSRNGYTTLTINQLFNHILKKTRFPEKSIVITFDDGYRDNYTNAYPILKKYRINATVFMISDATSHNDYLTEEQIKEMSLSGIDVQSHSVHHPHMDELSSEKQYKELKDSKEYIEKLTGKEVEYFAFPFGRYNNETIQMLKTLGYKMAFRAGGGWGSVHNSHYEVCRVYIGGFDSLETFINKVTKN